MTKSAFPHWIYDGSPIPDPKGYGQNAVDFVRLLKHPASAAPRNRFQLYEWQERIIRRIYGPVDEDGERLVREVFFYIPRGNRKTSLAAVLGGTMTGAFRFIRGSSCRPKGWKRRPGLNKSLICAGRTTGF